MNVYFVIEAISVLILVLVLVGLLIKPDKSRSSKALLWATWANIVCSVANALIYIEYRPGWSMFLFTMGAVTYIMGNITMLLFTYYDYCYIREYTPINRWVYYFPMGICVLNFFLSIFSVAFGDVFTYEGGVYTETTGLPVVIFLLYFLCMVYMPIPAIIKRKELGNFKCLMFCIFSVFPLITLTLYVFELTDYTYFSGSISILAMYMFLDHQLVLDKDQQLRNEMCAHQRDLEVAKLNAESASSSKTAFLLSMSHNIRTPMNAIIGFARLLRKYQTDADKREDYLTKIDNSSRVLLSIINNVLEMARIEKGYADLAETPVSTNHFVSSIADLFSERMQQKGLAFNVHNHTTHNYIFLDETKMREVLINLLSNAYKYTPTGGSVDFIATESPCDKEGYTMFHAMVKDTGIGMSREFLPHLFDEFARETNYSDNEIEGTGLGMPIVKRLVDLMNGTIEVESELGQGSCLTISIPFRIAVDADDKTVLQSDNLHVDFQGYRALLAEDNDLNAEIVCELLGEKGMTVDRVTDGLECVSQLTKSPSDYYQVILMDIQMPRLNGYDAAKAIRQLPDTAKAGVPILALTANAFTEDKRNAIEAGMNGHVGKPIDPKELYRNIIKVLSA